MPGPKIDRVILREHQDERAVGEELHFHIFKFATRPDPYLKMLKGPIKKSIAVRALRVAALFSWTSLVKGFSDQEHAIYIQKQQAAGVGRIRRDLKNDLRQEGFGRRLL